MGNAAGAAWGDVSKIIPHSSGFLGKLLQGTPFGPDPSKAATDANTLATIDNTAALRTMALSASGGGGGSVSGASGVLSRLYSSGSAGIDSGYTSDGVQKYSPENYDSSGQFLGAGATSAHDPSIHAGAVGTSALGKGVGYAAAIAAGGFGIYHGIEQGGLSGAASATGSAASMAAGIMTIAGVTGPAAPILMGVGLGLALLPSLFGDPKQKRASDLDSDRQQRLFTMPTGQDYSMDARGRYTDYNYQGQGRTINLNANIYAMDSVSLRDYLTANPQALASSLTSAIAGGNAEDVVGTLQQRIAQ